MKLIDKEKLKEKKEAFDILWNNPKYKAIIKLSIWFVLILTLSLFVRIGSTLEEPVIESKPPIAQEKNIKQQLKEITSYEVTITIDEETIKKQVLNNTELINYQNNIYYYENMKTNNEQEELIEKTLFFNTNNIYSLIENIEEEYTTKYKDGKYITNYKISNQEFMIKYNNTQIENEEYINITIEGQQEIKKISIDLSKLDQIEYNNITLELTNINNIDNIEVGE